MNASESTTGRDIVIALLLLSGVSVGGPLLFPTFVSVEQSGLLLGAVFAMLIVVAVVARLSGAAMGIGRVLLVAVILGTAVWGLRLYAGHQQQAETAAAFTEAVDRFGAETDALRERFAAEAGGLPLPPVTDAAELSDPSRLPEYSAQAGAYRQWAENARASYLEALDAEIQAVRDAAGNNPDRETTRALGAAEDRASRIRDYWQRYWDAEVRAAEVTLDLLELLRSTPYTAELAAGDLVFENDPDRMRYEALLSQLAGIRESQAADRREFEEPR